LERCLLDFFYVRPRPWRWLVLALLLLCAEGAAETRQMVWLRAWDGHGRPFDLQQVRGQLVALTFGSRYTRDEAARINETLASHALGGDLIVISIVDLAGVPSFAHGYAKRKVAEHDQQGRIQFLIDEQGRLKQAFKADPQRRVDILVLDRDGALRGRFVGRQQVEDAVRLIDELRTSRAAIDAPARFR
jgi:hypothetical protein